MSRLLVLSSLVGLGMSGTCNYGISLATIPAPFVDGECQSQDLSLTGETTSMMFSCDDELISAWNYTANCSGDPDYYLTPTWYSCDDYTDCDYIDADLAFWYGEVCSASGIQIGTGTFSVGAGALCFDASAIIGIGYFGISADADGLSVNVYFDDACAGTVVDGTTYGDEDCIIDNGTSIYPEFTYNSDSGNTIGQFTDAPTTDPTNEPTMAPTMGSSSPQTGVTALVAFIVASAIALAYQ